MKYLVGTLLAVMLLFAAPSIAQQKRHPGIDLYTARNYDAAIVSLETAVQLSENDGELWNYLGLAYLAKDRYKDAQKALEKAIKKAPSVSVYHANLAFIYMHIGKASNARGEAGKAIKLDPANVNAYYVRGTANIRDSKLDSAEADATKAININPAFSQGYVLLANVYVARLIEKVSSGSKAKSEILFLQKALEILRVGAESCKNSPNRKIIDEETESVSAFYSYFSNIKSVSLNDNLIPAEPDPNITPLKIILKPSPGYTDSARQRNIQGTVKMVVLFGASGNIEQVLIVKRIGGGLDERAAAAARRIIFEPMFENGKPVSTVRMLEYTFSIY